MRPVPRDELAAALAGRDPDLVERLTALLMSADQAFWAVDLGTSVIAVSRNLEIAFGHRVSELGHDAGRWRELVHPADLPGVVASARAAIASDETIWTFELRLRVVDGSYTPVRCTAAIVRDSSGRAVELIGSLSDMSWRVNEIAELRSRTHALLDKAVEAQEEQARRRLIERAIDEVVWEWDTSTNTVTFSGALGTLFGYTEDQVEETLAWWEDRIHPEDRAGVRHSLAMHLADDLDEWIGTYRFRRADGSYEWVRDRGYLERGGSKDHRRMVGAMSLIEPPDGSALTREAATAQLSPRQLQVLKLVRAGYTNKQIAVRLHMGEQSAKDHVSRLLKLLRAPNRAALVAAADDVQIVGDRRSGPRRESDVTPFLFAVTRGPDHILVSASPAVLAFTPGRTPLGKALRIAYPELAGQGVFEMFDTVYQHGKGSSAERFFARFEQGSGTTTVAAAIHLEPITDGQGNVDGVLAYGADVSPRTRADAPSAAGLREQMKALDMLPIGAILADASGGIVSMNEEARRVLGPAITDGRPIPSHASQYGLRDAATGQELGPDATAIARALRGEVVARLEYVLRPPGADVDVVLRTSAMPVRGPQGIVAVMLTFSEVQRPASG